METNRKPASNAEARRVARLTGEVTLETSTPFAAVVRTNRSKKAAKGTPVTVAKIFKGDWGPCAICHTEDGEKIFLSLGNLTHKGKADAKIVKAGNPLFDNGTVPGWLWDAKLREARIPADFTIVA